MKPCPYLVQREGKPYCLVQDEFTAECEGLVVLGLYKINIDELTKKYICYKNLIRVESEQEIELLKSMHKNMGFKVLEDLLV